MYLLNNLNWLEFEKLGKDIFEKNMNTKFVRMTPGPDGGIDLINYKNKIVVQCKHIESYANLLSSLKKEVPKLLKLVDQNLMNEYYVFTSCKLNTNRRIEIYKLFANYMDNEGDNIFDFTDIQDMLTRDDYLGVVKSNHKLYLSSVQLIKLLGERLCDNYVTVLKSEIPEITKKFVETEAFWKSWRSLIHNGAILIVGNPGVGKSTISKMLVSTILKWDGDFEIIHLSSNDIDKIINEIDLDQERKQLVFLDDFLGKTYLNVNLNALPSLESLLTLVSNNKNKKLILNSRITILEEVRPRSFTFSSKIDKNLSSIIVDVGELSLYEKALIFYNHMYFSGVPSDFYVSLLDAKKYEKIVEHKNYNPRIIEYCTDPSRLIGLEAHEYADMILDNLNNPNSVWNDEFNNYSDSDRILCTILYTLSDNYVDGSVLKELYNKYVLENNLRYDEFQFVIDRLGKSVLKVKKYSDSEKWYVTFSNPSLLDYIGNYLSVSRILQNRVLKGSSYLNQVKRILKINSEKSEDIQDYDLLKLGYLSYTSRGYIKGVDNYSRVNLIFEIITMFKVMNYDLKNSISELIDSEKTIYRTLLLTTDKELSEFYQVDSILNTDRIDFMFNNDFPKQPWASAVINEIDELDESISNLGNSNVEALKSSFKRNSDYFNDLFSEYSDDLRSDYLNENLSELIQNMDYDTSTDEDGDIEIISDYWNDNQVLIDDFKNDLLVYIESVLKSNFNFKNLGNLAEDYTFEGNLLDDYDLGEKIIKYESDDEVVTIPPKKQIDYHVVFEQKYVLEEEIDEPKN